MMVEEFRQILLWPIALSRGVWDVHEPVPDMVRELAMRVDSDPDWEWLKDGLAHIEDDRDTPKEDGGYSSFAYQEFVYFHDFVARFLYATQSSDALTGNQPMQAFHLFRHRTLRGTSVVLDSKNPLARIDLHIARCNLYLFRTGIAILALEVSSKDPRGASASLLSMDEVLRFSDVFRRLYTPFFNVPGTSEPCAVPTSVTWTYADGSTSLHRPRSLAAEVKKLRERKESEVDCCDAPLAEHWQALLPRELRFASEHVGDPPRFVARHILDERMAVLSFIRLGTPEALAALDESDWMRLCFVDGPGKGFPYDKEFLKNFDEQHAYDRFRSDGTRHLFSSYSYVVVSAGDFARDNLVHHFRRMYFQMGLIAYMEYATYVSISSKVSKALEAVEGTVSGIDGKAFREALFRIQADFLDFVHRFRFSSISNQVQAVEMYGMFRRHLRLAALFEDLKAELETATSYLRDADNAEQSLSSEGLNVVAAVGVTLGLAVGLLGALPNFKSWFGGSFDSAASNSHPGSAVVNAALTTIWTGLTFLGFSAASLALTFKATALFSASRRPRQSVKLIQAVLVAICASSLLAIALALAAYITHR